MLLGWKPTDVPAGFGQNDHGRSSFDSLDQGQVYAQSLEQRVLGFELKIIAFAPTLAWLSGPGLLSGPVGQLRQFCLNLLIALGDLLVVKLVQFPSLSKLKEMFGAPGSFQREGNLVFAVMTPLIAQFGQFDGIAFALRRSSADL